MQNDPKYNLIMRYGQKITDKESRKELYKLISQEAMEQIEFAFDNQNSKKIIYIIFSNFLFIF
jgi:hypothetical protein